MIIARPAKKQIAAIRVAKNRLGRERFGRWLSRGRDFSRKDGRDRCPRMEESTRKLHAVGRFRLDDDVTEVFFIFLDLFSAYRGHGVVKTSHRDSPESNSSGVWFRRSVFLPKCSSAWSRPGPASGSTMKTEGLPPGETAHTAGRATSSGRLIGSHRAFVFGRTNRPLSRSRKNIMSHTFRSSHGVQLRIGEPRGLRTSDNTSPSSC